MKNQQEHLNELYRKILHGSSRTGDKEKLAQWMAGLDMKSDDLSPDELAAEQEQSRKELAARFFPTQDRPVFRLWMVAASVAIILLGSIFFFNINSNNTPQQATIAFSSSVTQAGERKKITFTDGSVITLNSISKIRYPEKFSDSIREVFLEGQAFFEVSHDKSRPFIVHAEKLDVQVLGTTFDVKSYKDDKEDAVTVASGKVAVRPGMGGLHTLLPSDQLIIDRGTGKADRYTVEPAEYTGWQEGNITFRDQELGEVCRELERAYGVKMLIKTRDLEKTKMNFRIKNENIANVMKMLAVAGDFRYSIKDRTITLRK